MRRLRSWTGAVFAALYALAFVALYVDYVRRAGAWFADLPLSLAALPFTVIAAGLFGSALAYLAGLIVETIVRLLVRLALRSRAPGR